MLDGVTGENNKVVAHYGAEEAIFVDRLSEVVGKDTKPFEKFFLDFLQTKDIKIALFNEIKDAIGLAIMRVHVP